jgi:hypothetical protein
MTTTLRQGIVERRPEPALPRGDRPNLGRIGRFQVDTLEHPIETS